MKRSRNCACARAGLPGCVRIPESAVALSELFVSSWKLCERCFERFEGDSGDSIVATGARAAKVDKSILTRICASTLRHRARGLASASQMQAAGRQTVKNVVSPRCNLLCTTVVQPLRMFFRLLTYDRAHPGGGTTGIRAGGGWRSSVALILRRRLG
jgi:hypothetical protein